MSEEKIECSELEMAKLEYDDLKRKIAELEKKLNLEKMYVRETNDLHSNKIEKLEGFVYNQSDDKWKEISKIKEEIKKHTKFYDVATRTDESGTDWLWRVQIIDRIIDNENEDKNIKSVLKELGEEYEEFYEDIADAIKQQENIKSVLKDFFTAFDKKHGSHFLKQLDGEKEVNLEASSTLNESSVGSITIKRNVQDLANSKPSRVLRGILPTDQEEAKPHIYTLEEKPSEPLSKRFPIAYSITKEEHDKEIQEIYAEFLDSFTYIEKMARDLNIELPKSFYFEKEKWQKRAEK